MKAIISRNELERAYTEINRCPMCGQTGKHTCGGDPLVYLNRPTEIVVEVNPLGGLVRRDE